MDGAGARVEDLLRELAPQALAAVLRRYRDFPSAEDAVQEALLAASIAWPRDGVPENPRAWLVQVAFRRLTDEHRAEQARRRREDLMAGERQREHDEIQRSIVSPLENGGDGDDVLVLLFMCCHPALTPPSAVALTLRAVGGLTTAEIAKAFLVSEATMAQRISRAKETVRDSGVPFQMPSVVEWPERLRAVLHVLYLMFNEGYTNSVGPDLQRPELANEAIRLARMMHALRADDAEVAGLLALMLLVDARRAARSSTGGDLVPLDEQDRTLWDPKAIAEGVALVTAALAKGPVGPFQLQAAIAAVHDEAARFEDTDWPQILALYGVLERMAENPMVTLNRAVALAMVHGPRAGLDLLQKLEGDGRVVKESHRLDAVRAHLFEMAGDANAALAHYRSAAGKTTNIPEQRYLLARAGRLVS
ncbi:MAG: RNA polymerase subunit sigma-24 [Myxococcales bacterium 68-20]|nr:MAG: RNA polymerase subunit sigma-24 [Myxococcales bacterium 68-20]